jgi:hypothetical protein
MPLTGRLSRVATHICERLRNKPGIPPTRVANHFSVESTASMAVQAEKANGEAANR